MGCPSNIRLDMRTVEDACPYKIISRTNVVGDNGAVALSNSPWFIAVLR